MEHGHRSKNQSAGKRKKKFLYRAKKKFKEDRFGVSLDKDAYEYFLRIADTFKSHTEQEDKCILAENVIKETIGKENEVTSHPLSSRVLESIIPFTSWESLSGLRESFAGKRNWSQNGCKARVHEALIREAGKRAADNSCAEYVQNTSNFYLNNIEEQLTEPNFNFIARACIEVCAGHLQSFNTNKKPNDITVEPLYPEIVKKYLNMIISWPQINDFHNNDTVSGFLQTLITLGYACCPKTTVKLAKALLDSWIFKAKETVFDSTSCSRLLETIIEIVDKDIYEEIYNNLFKGNIVARIADRKSRFSVVKLIRRSPGKLQFESMFSELEHFSEFLQMGTGDIIAVISECCMKFGTKQGDFIKLLKTALECDKENDKQFLLCVLSLKPPNEIGNKLVTDKNGSQIIQNALMFKKPIKIIESLLSLDSNVLKEIAEDPKGSRVFDAFLTSQFVGEKSRDRLFDRFNGLFCELAMTKFGSRVFDSLWPKANKKQRDNIMKEMTRRIFSTQYGTHIAQKIDFNTYLNDKSKWNPNIEK